MFRKTIWERFFDWIFGYDLFISYSRIDWDERYAVDLAQRLSGPPYEFKCFLDAKTMETGLSWKVQGRRALRKSSKIILLLTPGIVHSPGVRDELEYNNNLGLRRKDVTVIDIKNAWEQVCKDTAFVKLLSGTEGVADESIRINEHEIQKPTDAVLQRIRSDFALRTENSRRNYVLSVVALALLSLAVGVGVLAEIARQQRNQATLEKEQAQINHSLLLTTLSNNERARNNPVTSRFLALKALPEQTWSPERSLVNEAMDALLLSDRSFVRPQIVLADRWEGPGDGGIKRVHFSFDSSEIVTQSWYGGIRIWSAANGALVKDIGKRYGQTPVSAMSTGAPLLALSSRGTGRGRVNIWDTVKGKILYTLETPDKISSVVFGVSCCVATRETNGTIRVWRLATGLEAARLERQLGDNLAIAFSSNDTLVTFSGRGIIETWSAKDGKKASTFDTGLGLVERAELSETGELAVLFHAKDVASYKIQKVRDNDKSPWREEKSCSPCVAEVWNVRERKSVGVLSEYDNTVFPLIAISPTLKTVAFRFPQNGEVDVGLWDVTSHRAARLSGHESRVEDIVFSRDGRFVGTSSWDRTTRIWSVEAGTEVATLRGHSDHVNAVEFDESGMRVVTGSKDSTARVWNLSDRATIAELTPPSEPLSALAFNQDGTLLAAAGGKTRSSAGRLSGFHEGAADSRCDGMCIVRIWNTETWQATLDLENEDFLPGILAFHPNGRLLLTAPRHTSTYYSSHTTSGTGCYGCDAIVWNLGNGAREYRVHIDQGVISDAKFSPDGRWAVVASDSGHIYVFDARGGSKIADLGGHTQSVKEVAFDATSSRLLSASSDRSIRLWDVETWKFVRLFEGHKDKVGYVQFDADGGRFVSSSADGTARIWNTKTGEQIAVLSGHSAAVNQAKFVEGGALVAAGSDDNTIMIWNAIDGSRIHVLRGHRNSGAFSGVTEIFSLDADRVLSFGTDGTARVWDIPRGVELDITTPPYGLTKHVSVSPSGDRLAAMRGNERLQILSLAHEDVFQKIDVEASTSYPASDEQVRGIPGFGPVFDALNSQNDNLAARVQDIRTVSQAFDAAQGKNSLRPAEIERLAARGAAGALARLALSDDRSLSDREALGRAFFHHRIAERLFRIIGRENEARFHAARRVSLASVLSRSDVSRLWREAQQWHPSP